jgi:hypothetical protein
MGTAKHYQPEIQDAAWQAHRRFKEIYNRPPNLLNDCYCRGVCHCDHGEKDCAELLHFGQKAMEAYGWGAIDDQPEDMKAELRGAIKDVSYHDNYEGV